MVVVVIAVVVVVVGVVGSLWWWSLRRSLWFLSSSSFKKNRLRTDGRRDRPTEQPTDTLSYRDGWTHLKIGVVVVAAIMVVAV